MTFFSLALVASSSFAVGIATGIALLVWRDSRRPRTITIYTTPTHISGPAVLDMLDKQEVA